MELLQNMNRVNTPVHGVSTSFSTPIAEPMAAPGYRQHGGRAGFEYDDGGYSSDGSYCTDASEVDALRARAQAVLESERGVAFTALQRVCDRTGIPCAAHVTKNADISAIRAEGDRIENEVAVRRSIKFQRRALLLASSGVEYLHNKSPMIKGRLTGWGEALLDGIDDFDVVFRRLHAKHGPRIKNGRPSKEMEPEMELLYMVAYNAFTFTLTQSIANLTAAVPPATPQVDDPMAMMQARVRDAKTDSDRVRQFTDGAAADTPPTKKTTSKKGERVMQL
jgi:hypothetical protein